MSQAGEKVYCIFGVQDGYHGGLWMDKCQDEQHFVRVPASVFPFPFLISSLLPRSVCSCIRSSGTIVSHGT